eukprot:TRINITY_DN38721_c0_g1_i1.p1 TRINITY_DN38721_c0_g1~~TRINITY_DN38721_c0_g1_i1.p1  ORF type:complete len:1230 (-),score=154.74 TRINITY_DN38721_c0_g1_i1:449-4138(-)
MTELADRPRVTMLNTFDSIQGRETEGSMDHADDTDACPNHVRVAVRVRPFSQRELTLGCACVVSMNEATTVVHSSPSRAFKLDASFWSHDSSSEKFSSQEAVMNDLGVTTLRSALGGFNCTVFAYGQTGSGKSHSIFGSKSAPGLIPWTSGQLFAEKQRLDVEGAQELCISVSYFELFGEDIRDLLHDANGCNETLHVVDHPKIGLHIPSLANISCDTFDDFQSLLRYGTKARVLSATSMNDHSSRSHAIFTLTVKRLFGKRPQAGDDVRRSVDSKISFFDMAGSERQSKTSGLATSKEGCANNRGLVALGEVVQKLSQSSKNRSVNVPFRISKLPLLLKDALSGNDMVQMIATISPASDNMDESIGTLMFASAVQRIPLKPIANVHAGQDRKALADHLQLEVHTLQARLAKQPEAVTSQVIESELRDKMSRLGALTENYQTRLKQAKAFIEAREMVVEEMEMSRDCDKSTPYLLNMSDDATLAGCLLYYILAGEQRTVGSSQDSSIQLRGIGIPSRLCVLENKGNISLTIAKCGEKGRVVVSGKPLESGRQQMLRHGQRIFLGRAFAMKAYLPAASSMPSPPQRSMTPDDPRNVLLDSLEDDSAAIDHSPMWKYMQDFVHHMIKQMPTEHANAFIEEVKLAVKVCDEANDITFECRPGEGLSFECDITGAMRPSVVVRVLKSWGRESDGSEQCQQLYIWSSSQMMERLDRMKECYHAFIHKGVLEVNSLEDPWHEIQVTDVWQHVPAARIPSNEKTLAVSAFADIGSDTVATDSEGFAAVLPSLERKRKALNAFFRGSGERMLRPVLLAWRKVSRIAPKSVSKFGNQGASFHRASSSFTGPCAVASAVSPRTHPTVESAASSRGLRGATHAGSGFASDAGHGKIAGRRPESGAFGGKDVPKPSQDLTPRNDTSLLDRFEALLNRMSPGIPSQPAHPRRAEPRAYPVIEGIDHSVRAAIPLPHHPVTCSVSPRMDLAPRSFSALAPSAGPLGSPVHIVTRHATPSPCQVVSMPVRFTSGPRRATSGPPTQQRSVSNGPQVRMTSGGSMDALPTTVLTTSSPGCNTVKACPPPAVGSSSTPVLHLSSRDALSPPRNRVISSPRTLSPSCSVTNSSCLSATGTSVDMPLSEKFRSILAGHVSPAAPLQVSQASKVQQPHPIKQTLMRVTYPPAVSFVVGTQPPVGAVVAPSAGRISPGVLPPSSMLSRSPRSSHRLGSPILCPRVPRLSSP